MARMAVRSVVIAVPTLGARPLPALLAAVAGQAALARQRGYEVRVALLDNSPAGSAAARRAAAGHGVEYVRVPERGFAQVRNAALDTAGDADVLVFIDDDEFPVPGWLLAFLDGARTHAADVAVGPVRVAVPERAPAWVADGALLRSCGGSRPDGPLTGPAYSGNTLLRLAPVRAAGLRFGAEFDRVGGEDTAFFGELAERGAHMVWIDAAAVAETPDPDRLTLRGLVRRFYLSGYGNALADRAARRPLLHLGARRAGRALRGLGRLAAAVVLARAPLAARGLADVAFAGGWWAALARPRTGRG
ncbi:glycosyltransferase family 2 protein [Streptomyces sp. A7024]|uniref:Glycosyltransferase family 2 protein n=1 Tax=Streptomyces coryli TaxID=1128680 RepID=A0A6G4TZA2_9ACTN|nr:glycosyltransferase [Streptomyces coryli]NGN65082.1 glycosyltransferase family 2 protein [Streptomyces coryli]